MKLKLILLYLLSVLTFTSCYKEFDMEKHRPEPKLVLNCRVTADSLIVASVTRTWFYLEKNPNVTLRDAKVDLYVNGEYKQQMWWEENEDFRYMYNTEGVYFSSVTAQEGDQIKIVATGEYGTVTAEDTVPGAALVDVKITYEPENEYSGYIIYTVTLKDQAETTDYYLIKVIGYEDRGESWDYYIYTSYRWIDWGNEPLFLPDHSGLDNILSETWIDQYGGIAFSDELINGKEYTFKGKEIFYNGSYYNNEYTFKGEEIFYNDSYYNPEDYIHKRAVYLCKISQSYYRYLFVLQNYWSSLQVDLADLGLAEPVRIYSNVQGGTGILGCSNSGIVEVVELTDLLPK